MHFTLPQSLLEAKFLLSLKAKGTAAASCHVKKVRSILQKSVVYGDLRMPFPE